MDKIGRELIIEIEKDRAFEKFLDEFDQWWPKEYTWAQDQLREIRIDGREDGLCTEIGPYGFRCDWGRVTELTRSSKIVLKWQISPDRLPVPNPEQASEVEIRFSNAAGCTSVEFEHRNFENHGEGARQYFEMMNSEQGWDYILNAYKSYCLL